MATNTDVNAVPRRDFDLANAPLLPAPPEVLEHRHYRLHNNTHRREDGCPRPLDLEPVVSITSLIMVEEEEDTIIIVMVVEVEEVAAVVDEEEIHPPVDFLGVSVDVVLGIVADFLMAS